MMTKEKNSNTGKNLAENISLTNPVYEFDEKKMEKDIELCRKQGLDQVFIRRRTVLFMDACRYAHDVAQKRWGINFAFYETGYDPVKRVFQSSTLNKEAATIWLEKMKEDPSFGWQIVQELQKFVEEEKKLAEDISNITLSKEEARFAILKHLDYMARFLGLIFLWFAVDPMKQEIDKHIKEQWKGSQKELEEFLEKVYRPVRFPVSSIEQRDLVNILKLEGMEAEDSLRKHQEKYKHLSLHHIDDDYFPLAYYQSRINSLQDKTEYKHQKEILESADKEIEEANKLLDSANLSNELKKQIEFVRWFMYLRTESVDNLMLLNKAYKPVIEFIAGHLNMSSNFVLNMTYKEIIDSLKGLPTTGKDIIINRTKKGYAYFIGPENSVLTTGEDIEKLEQSFIGNKPEIYIKELKGQIAFKGKIQGIARVILDRRKAYELKEGEILVTAMTAPDFVPAMKLSSGIITNEGGILCHAAIMSRELRKPCIIGTKIATDVIKTGQIITLDADKGVIYL